MYDSLIRLRSIIRLPIHKDNNDMVNTIDMNHTNEIYKYKMEDIHYKAISTLQRYYGKKIGTSKGPTPGIKLSFLKEMKAKQFYTTREKIMLNDMRDEYLKDKKTTP